VADANQFGRSKVLQFGDKTAGNQPGSSGHCAQCEAMLADALDGTLSAADQELFDAHMAQCGPCAQLLADARRGAAWLEMLRTPAPEPPAALLERILAQTSGDPSQMIPMGMQHAGFTGATLAGPQSDTLAPGYALPGTAAAYGTVIPFRQRVRASAFGQIFLQPRVAMTAAMAFFSIVLTMNLTGVHLQDLHASDFTPSSLKRDFYSANARVARYCDGVRFVYELESRVHDLQTATDNDAAAGSPSAVPTDSPNSQASPAQPDGATPVSQPATGPDHRTPAAQPEQKNQPAPAPASKPAPNSGTSRREGPGHPLYGLASVLVADSDSMNSNSNTISSNGNNERVEGSLV
jgi:hypothetical protein